MQSILLHFNGGQTFDMTTIIRVKYIGMKSYLLIWIIH